MCNRQAAFLQEGNYVRSFSIIVFDIDIKRLNDACGYLHKEGEPPNENNCQSNKNKTVIYLYEYHDASPYLLRGDHP